MGQIGTTTDTSFGLAARRAVRRLVVARWLRDLAWTSVIVFPVLGALTAALWWRGTVALTAPWAGVVVALWLIGTAAWAWRRRPTPVAALAAWDARAGRHEMFTSALCFE